MNNNNRPLDSELPSVAKLVKSTIIAITLAAIVLVTGVLPAEYGIDPTGIGNLLGLSKMGEIKASLAQEAAADKTVAKTKDSPAVNSPKMAADSVEKTVTAQLEAPVWTDKMTISLRPNEGKEVKLKMKKGGQVNYVWWTENGQANFDAHADSKKHRINYHSYDKGKTGRKEGIMAAAFDGKHGWFWRNRTTEIMKIILQVAGEYSDIIQEG